MPRVSFRYAIKNKVDGICIGVMGIHPKGEIDNEVEVICRRHFSF